MSYRDEIHVNDVGTTFTITITENGSPMDISSATTKEFHFDKPNANGMFTKAASFATDGTDGKIKYVSESEVLDMPGEWKIQAHVVMPNGEWRTNIDTFRVYENINAQT